MKALTQLSCLEGAGQRQAMQLLPGSSHCQTLPGGARRLLGTCPVPSSSSRAVSTCTSSAACKPPAAPLPWPGSPLAAFTVILFFFLAFFFYSAFAAVEVCCRLSPVPHGGETLPPPWEQQERAERCNTGTSVPWPSQPQALGVCIPLSRSKHLLGSSFPQPPLQPSWGGFVQF